MTYMSSQKTRHQKLNSYVNAPLKRMHGAAARNIEHRV